MRPLSHADLIAMMQPVGGIAIAEGKASIALDSIDDRPAVYAWVIGQEVVYIGKAGRGLKRRVGQWRQGFRGTGRGGQQAAYLIERGEPVVWMAFWPEPVSFRRQMIASHSSVEEWLIGSTAPTPVMNREGGR